MSKKLISLALAAALALSTLTACSSNSSSEEVAYPTEPVTIVVASSAGGGTDTAARLVARYLEEDLGVSFPISNNGSGSGIIAYEEVANADPDGYKAIFYNENFMAASASGTIDFGDEVYEIVGIPMETNTVTLFTNGDKFTTFEEMIDYAKANPGELKLAGRQGATTGQVMRYIEDAFDIEVSHVDLGANSESIAGVAGGHVDVYTAPFNSISDYVEKGDFVVLAQFNETSEEYPTAKSLGIEYEFSKFWWMGMPAGTPEEVITTISNSLKTISEDPKFIEEVENLNNEVSYYTPAEARTRMQETLARLVEYNKKYS